MKKIEVITKEFKLEEIKTVLANKGRLSVIISEVGDVSRQSGYVGHYRGVEYVVDILPKIKIEIIVEDEKARELAIAISDTFRTGSLCDGHVSVLPIDAVIQVRTGDHCYTPKTAEISGRLQWHAARKNSHRNGREELKIVRGKP